MKPFTIASVLPKGLGGFVNAKVVSLTLNHFWSSTDDVIDTQHVPNRYVNTNGREEHPTEAKKRVQIGTLTNLFLKSEAFEIISGVCAFTGLCTRSTEDLERNDQAETHKTIGVSHDP